jgi:hypothetical protein
VKLFPHHGPPGQHRDPRRQGEPDRFFLLAREPGPGPAAQPPERLAPVHGGEPGQAVAGEGMQPEQGVSQGPFGLMKRRQVDGGDLRCGAGRGGTGRSRDRGRRQALAHHPSAAASSSRHGVIRPGGTPRIFAASATRLGSGS